MEENFPIFTEEMKKTHTILLPMMLPIHFSLIQQVLERFGYKTELLKNQSHDVIEEGLKNVHNDTCYPALLVIGQMLTALKSGKYDTDKVALMITQTGGGCRASNYIFLLRKALIKSGFPNVPIISLNFSNPQSTPGFKLTLPLIIHLVHAVVLGDFLMLLSNKCRPYEVNKGDSQALVEKWQSNILKAWGNSKYLSYSKIKHMYPLILRDFTAIPKAQEKKIKVGIVGEIYVKYSPMGNNHLTDFLISEGAEPVIPGLIDFFLYCIYNSLEDKRLYGGSSIRHGIFKIVYRYFLKMEDDMLSAIEKNGIFPAPTSF
ncbi:MAG: 2-hydroxyacyl-CoA dehydratase, partial [Oscillospiraceae bacterium]